MKLPCFVFIYRNYFHITKCIDYLTDFSNLDITVIENKSEYTKSHIQPYVSNLLKSGKIKQYFLFSRNISNNALEVFFDSHYYNVGDAPFLILTDGDLIPDNPNWLDEQITIMEKHTDVFACALDLDLVNLPVQSFPEAVSWIGAGSLTDDYVEVDTGLTMLLLRTSDFHNFLKFRRANNKRFKDSIMRDFCKGEMQKKWVRTKKSKAYHLTWDLYNDLQDSYTIQKILALRNELWTHYEYSPFQAFTQEKSTWHFPAKKYLKGKITNIKRALRSLIYPK